MCVLVLKGEVGDQHGSSLQDTVEKSPVKIVEPLLGGGESVRSEKSSGKSLITTDSVRETTKLEVDSLKVSCL